MSSSTHKDAYEDVRSSQMIEIDEATQKRYKRYEDFEKFYDKAHELFKPYKNKDERTKYLQATHMLEICPGSRCGGKDRRYVEIFWGNKAFDTNEEIKHDYRLHQVIYSEHGAVLTFYKNENGFTSIYLIPAGTQLTHPYEDGICWKKKVDPAKLHKKRFLDKAWRAFMAYMEVTQIDGEPTQFQKIHIWWLRNFRHSVIDNKWQGIKAVKCSEQIIKWVLTVSLSGLTIFLLQILLISTPAEHDNIINMKENTFEIKNQLDSIHQALDKISDKQDSLVSIQKIIINKGKP